VDKTLVNKLLDAAVMAPSGDNVQPWSFQVSENFTQIDLYNLPDKDRSYYNFQQAASYIAHGAVIENILISAKHLGCHADILLFPVSGNDNYVARISLSPAQQQNDPLYSVIFERSTNRFRYKRAELSGELLQALEDSVRNIDAARVSLVIQKDKIKKLAKELMVNDRIVFECKEIHKFLFDKIRWNKIQSEETKDGMPVDVLGLSYIEKLFFPLMRFWWYVKIGNVLGLSRIIELKCWWNCRNAPMLGMITIKGSDKYAFVEGGRAVQRFWLTATIQGLALQPIIGLPLLINRLRKNQLGGFSEKHQQFIQQANKLLPELFGVGKEDTLIMGFRAGISEEKIVRTLRRKRYKDVPDYL
jgi:hypothetical protein